MAFSDHTNPSAPKRRRGAKRSKGDTGYDDFWTRESVGPKTRGRRREDGELDDLADLAPPSDPRSGPARVRNRSAGAPPLPQRGGAAPVGQGMAGAPNPASRERAVPPAGGRGAAPRGYPGRDRSRPPSGGGYDDPWTGQTAAVGGDEPMSRYEAGASGYPARRRGATSAAYIGDQGRPPGASGRTRTRAWGTGNDLATGDTYGEDTYYDEHDDVEGEEEPRRRGCAIALAVLAVLVLAAAVAGWFGWSWVQDEIDPPGPQGEEVLVEVPDGTTTSGVGHAMAEAGVISNARVWDWYTKLRDVGSFQAGTYRMRLNSSFDEAIEDLKAEPLPPNSTLVTVPEGLTLTQLTQRLVDPTEGVPGFTPEGLQAALQDPAMRSAFLPPEQPTLEGTLFPETYGVAEGETEAQFLGRMVATLDETMNDLDATNRATQLGITPYQALIVASLVEEEARVPEDRPKVARVIYNRLAAGEALGIDATSCYEKGEIPCTLTESDLASDSQYNTRNRSALPPTPIASPGRASIEAALNPAEGPWRYYVLSDAEGHHAFTDNYDEFVRLKTECARLGLGCSA
jgi:peptidoglycan lytic transglycosylase G